MSIEETNNDELLENNPIDPRETAKTLEDMQTERAIEPIQVQEVEETTAEIEAPVTPQKERINAYSVVIPIETWGILRGDLEKLGLPEETTPTQYMAHLLANREKITAPVDAPISTPVDAPQADPTPAQETSPPYAYVRPPQPQWVKPALIIAGIILVCGIIWLVFRYGKKSGAKVAATAASSTVATAAARAASSAANNLLFDVPK